MMQLIFYSFWVSLISFSIYEIYLIIQKQESEEMPKLLSVWVLFLVSLILILYTMVTA